MIDLHPHASILVHPGSLAGMIELAHVFGSTTQLSKAIKSLPNKEFLHPIDFTIWDDVNNFFLTF